MKIGIKRGLCILTMVALLVSTLPQAVSAAADDNGITVSTQNEFMAALQQKKSPIIINDLITIGNEADTDGRMLPVMIPADTVIQGTGNGSLNCRCPIQLEGDVCFRNIKLTFESTNALGSVPHREIFLAGHGLTFDNVSTWLEGGDGAFGDISGTEKELLPTVYAGGFTNTSIGENASLTVTNSNDDTMFQAIYMGHDAENDNKVPYRGLANVSLDTKVTVRGKVDTQQNSQADLRISGTKNDSARTKLFYGNENTTLTLSGSSISDAVVENIGNIILTDNACLSSKTSSFKNVTLQQGGCLDLYGAQSTDVLISGDFIGVTDSAEEKGILVVNQKSTLTIAGKVTGTTQFQTYNRLYPSYFTPNWPYISADPENCSSNNFVLSEKSLEDGYQLNYNAGEWSVIRENMGDTKEVGGIEIVSAPSQVVLSKITQNEMDGIPDENVYFEIIWRDMEGNAFSADEVEEEGFYLYDTVFIVKTEYWDSDDATILAKTDWGNSIFLMTSEDHPGRYFLQADESATAGDYTFLFLSEYCSDPLDTVQDVKNLRNLIKTEKKVTFLNKEPEVTATPFPTPSQAPTATPTADASATPSATPSQAPTATPTADASATPSAIPSQAPTATPTADASSTPSPSPSGEPSSPTVTLPPIPTPSGETNNTPVSVVYPPAKLTLSAVRLVYTGKAQKPDVTVTDTKGEVISSADYQLSYQNNVKVGLASVTAHFRGNYSGTLTTVFQIVPKGTTLSKLSPKPKGFLIKWKKQRKQTTGYEIQYSTSKKFKKKTTKKIKGNKKSSHKISNGKPGKRYYVRIRTYKTVKKDGKVEKIYSSWSKAKSVKI